MVSLSVKGLRIGRLVSYLDVLQPLPTSFLPSDPYNFGRRPVPETGLFAHFVGCAIAQAFEGETWLSWNQEHVVRLGETSGKKHRHVNGCVLLLCEDSKILFYADCEERHCNTGTCTLHGRISMELANINLTKALDLWESCFLHWNRS